MYAFKDCFYKTYQAYKWGAYVGISSTHLLKVTHGGIISI